MWSEMAKWSLDFTGHRYTEQHHLIMIDEVALRLRARSMQATVPLLVDGRTRVMGAEQIARYADKQHHKLFPADKTAEMGPWIASAMRAARAGRTIASQEMLSSTDFLLENLPPWVPEGMRGLMVPSARMALNFLAKKHGFAKDDLAVEQKVLEAFAQSVDEATHGKRTLCGKFTFADIACASVFEFVAPVGDAYIPIGAATRRALTNRRADKMMAALAWRDFIYTKFRR